MTDSKSVIEIVTDFSRSEGYEVTQLDEEWPIYTVSDGNKYATISAGMLFPINSHSATMLASDKTWTYARLASNHNRVIEGKSFFTKDKMGNFIAPQRKLAEAIEYAQSIGFPVFVKPNSQSCGILARMDYTAEDLIQHFKEIELKDRIAIVQKPMDMPEYRIFVLDGNVEFAYCKKLPFIKGDGKADVRTLLQRLNQTMEKSHGIVSEESIFLNRQLQTKGLNLDSVLANRQEITASPIGNLSTGGVLSQYTENITPRTTDWAVTITRQMGLRVSGIDIFSPDGLANPDKFTIIEVNSNPSLSGIYEAGKASRAHEIYALVLAKFFKGV